MFTVYFYQQIHFRSRIKLGPLSPSEGSEGRDFFNLNGSTQTTAGFCKSGPDSLTKFCQQKNNLPHFTQTTEPIPPGLTTNQGINNHRVGTTNPMQIDDKRPQTLEDCRRNGAGFSISSSNGTNTISCSR